MNHTILYVCIRTFVRMVLPKTIRILPYDIRTARMFAKNHTACSMLGSPSGEKDTYCTWYVFSNCNVPVIRLSVLTYAHTLTHYTDTYTHTHIHNICTHTHTHLHTDTLRHTHIHTYTHTFTRGRSGTGEPGPMWSVPLP